jgi:hypothetical protein
MKNQKECESCFYHKVRDFNPETGQFEFGPFCLKTGAPVRCEYASENCKLAGYQASKKETKS